MWVCEYSLSPIFSFHLAEDGTLAVSAVVIRCSALSLAISSPVVAIACSHSVSSISVAFSIGNTGSVSKINRDGVRPLAPMVSLSPLTVYLRSVSGSMFRCRVINIWNTRQRGAWYRSPLPIQLWDWAPRNRNAIPWEHSRSLNYFAANSASWSGLFILWCSV